MTPRAAGFLVGFILLLQGCALFQKPADSISFDRGEFLVAYIDAHTGAAILALKIRQACEAGRLGDQACAGVDRLMDQAEHIDRQFKRALRNPKTEVDWSAIASYIKLIVGLAAKAL